MDKTVAKEISRNIDTIARIKDDILFSEIHEFIYLFEKWNKLRRKISGEINRIIKNSRSKRDVTD
jgi:hypothetical protein